jgi:hypothetical protein
MDTKMTILASQSIRKIATFNSFHRLNDFDDFQFYEVRHSWAIQEILSLSNATEVQSVQTLENACNRPDLTYIVVRKNSFGPAMAARILGRTRSDVMVLWEGEYDE